MTYIALAAAALLVGIDQLTKYLAVTYIKPHGTVNLLSIGENEWLNLTYKENTGAAFSILKDKQTFLIILTSIVILGVIILMLSKRVKKTSYIWCFSFIIAGGIGNLIDRIVNNYVVDFIDFRIIKFAVFNFADICAVMGTFFLMLFYIRDEIKTSKEKKIRACAEEDSSEVKAEGVNPKTDFNTYEVFDKKNSGTSIKAEIRKKEDK
ncbi:MAG: signal peptidase II [Ruminiclostridium sp.]|nr:signal peptidase II [Ruminiclostridium sp.]